MFRFTDQTGRQIILDFLPRRIISLVPSQTELLYDLDVGEQVVGITKFCVHPEKWFRSKIKVGGTKKVNIDVIRRLRPDLVIANKEENVKEQIHELSHHFPVWVSDVSDLEGACHLIKEAGELTNKEKKASEIIQSVQNGFSGLRSRIDTFPGPAMKACYLIWQKPFMTAGGDTFIHAMLEAAGFENIFSGEKRYPRTTIDEISGRGCRLLLLSSEPFPFREKHIAEFRRLLPDTEIVLVNGEMFSWYGSRLLWAPAYFMELRKQIAKRIGYGG